jgi:arsenate reductase
MLDMDPIDLMRRKEDVYEELGLEEKKDNPNTLIKAMVKHPILIERPIVIKGDQARLGRPPESVLDIL